MLTVEDWIFLPACKSVSRLSVNSAWFERTYCMATSSITNTILIRFSIGMGGSPSPKTGFGLRYKTFTRSGVYNILIYPLALWPADRFQRKKSLDSIIEKILNMHTEVNNNCIYLTYFRGVIKNIRTFFLTKRKRLRKNYFRFGTGKVKKYSRWLSTFSFFLIIFFLKLCALTIPQFVNSMNYVLMRLHTCVMTSACYGFVWVFFSKKKKKEF